MMNSSAMSKLAGSTVRIRRCGIESATVTFAIVGILSRAATSDSGACLGRLLRVGCFQRRRSRPNSQMFSRQMKPNGLAYLRTALARNRDRAKPVGDAKDKLIFPAQMENVLHIAGDDVAMARSVISLDPNVFGTNCDQNLLADSTFLGTIRNAHLNVLHSVELDNLIVWLLFGDGSPESQYASQKILHERRLGTLIHLLWRTKLLDVALIHHGQAGRERHGLDLIMGHEKHREAELLLQPPELDAHLFPQLSVEVAQRFIQQKNAWRVDQRPRQ